MPDRRFVEVEKPPSGLERRDKNLRRFSPEDLPARTLEVEIRPVSLPVDPSLVSSAHGEIEHVLLWCPETGYGPDSVHADVLRLLPPATKITAVVSAEAAAEMEQTASAVCPDRDVLLLTAPDDLRFTVWAEDAMVVLQGGADGPGYIVEPENFGRAGDYRLAELTANQMSLQLTQAPLAFQGGNVLIGDQFVFIGRDYLEESIPIAAESVRGFPVAGNSEQQAEFVASLFRELLDPGRTFHFLSSLPTDRPEDAVVEIDGEQWLETVSAGRGRFQPIFHIDMFVTLAGRVDDGSPYRVLVGDPGEADRLLDWPPVDHNLQAEFDEIADQLESLGFEVIRSPLPYLPALFRAPEPFDVDGTPVVGEILWYHATTNNCLVQITDDSRQVWLPTYGHPPFPELALVDEAFVKLWQSLGFTAHQLGDFHPFARSLGALHCIKKYLSRRER